MIIYSSTESNLCRLQAAYAHAIQATLCFALGLIYDSELRYVQPGRNVACESISEAYLRTMLGKSRCIGRCCMAENDKFLSKPSKRYRDAILSYTAP